MKESTFALKYTQMLIWIFKLWKHLMKIQQLKKFYHYQILKSNNPDGKRQQQIPTGNYTFESKK